MILKNNLKIHQMTFRIQHIIKTQMIVKIQHIVKTQMIKVIILIMIYLPYKILKNKVIVLIKIQNKIKIQMIKVIHHMITKIQTIKVIILMIIYLLYKIQMVTNLVITNNLKHKMIHPITINNLKHQMIKHKIHQMMVLILIKLQ